ncbi:hypothetical protein [Rhodococcus sp. NCIMB 12038]|uniref:hypothetical protein n=1 Tax=Rhodococcus sp. NCIMB 12038 TaxID=933800 RepID=UPI00211AE9DB|nr:hypothetical protein [Rhodococcus sp. NCIMB 12038]
MHRNAFRGGSGTRASSLRARGSAVVVGLGAPEVAVNVQDLMLNGKTLRGCVEGDSSVQQFIPQLLALHAEGRFRSTASSPSTGSRTSTSPSPIRPRVR